MALNVLQELAARISKFFYDFDYYEFMDCDASDEMFLNALQTDAEGTYEFIARVAADCLENNYEDEYYDEAMQILMRMHEVLNVA